MNIALWIVQGLLALAFVGVGISHAFRAAQIKTRPGMEWVDAVDPRLMVFIGICEILGGFGMILPAVTGVLPWLTPLAGAVTMLLAAGFHLPRKEYRNIITNLVLMLFAALVSVGRFVIAPFA